MFGQNIFDDILGLPFQGELVFRIILACIVGAIIGYERRKRDKTAGMRTHIFAAMASTVFAICSKYSYFDVLVYENVSLDASRIAANIVTGICFLGAGMIFIRNRSVRGLTTSAGIWTVSAIGLCIGNGMYIVAIASAVIVIIIQYILYNSLDTFEGRQATECTIVVAEGEENAERLLDALREQDPHMKVTALTKESDGSFTIKIDFHSEKLSIEKDIWGFMKGYPYVTSCKL